jgi:hypothetical protein
MPRSYLLLLTPIEASQVTPIQSSKTTIILLVMLMNSYGQQVGSIMLPETRHISVMLLYRMEKIMLIGESQHGSVGMTNFQAHRFAWTELCEFIFQYWSYQSYLYNHIFIQGQEFEVHSLFLVQVLLSRLNFFGSKQISNAENEGLKNYRNTAEAVICGLLPDSPSATASRTAGTL